MTTQADADATLARYRVERDRRLNAKGNAQYNDATGALERFFNSDPSAAPAAPRAAIDVEIEVLVVGAGFSGILAAARLEEAGITDLRIVDMAADFGGTWYWNRYPGVQCDIEAYCYLPLLEETGYVPRHRYAFGDEIMAYCQHLGRHYDLYRRTVFQTRVTEAVWDEAASRWIVRTDRGDRFAARFMMFGPGRMSRPKLPGIKGIDTFQGHSFHTSRWDYDYTGGSTHEPLERLADKRVAVIGTGATGIQLIPRVAASAEHLYVFQRTPSSVGVRGNVPTDVAWYRSLTAGWQDRRRSLFMEAASGRADDAEVRDGWTETGRLLREGRPEGPETPAEIAARAAAADLRIMDARRARVDELVADPATAESLKAWYNLFCKRPTFNDEFLAAFNRPNVTLVDVSGDNAISEITATGVRVGDAEYPVDLIIYASGFQAIGSIEQRFTFPITGRNGVTLADHWAHGLRTLHGITAHNMPNWFYLGQGQNAVTANYTTTVDEQARHIAFILVEARRRGADVVEPTAAAERAWIDRIREANGRPASFYEACTPGYYNNEGQGGINIWDESYAAGPAAFSKLLQDWRERGDLEGLELRY